MAKLALALVLCDVVGHGLKAGQLLEAEPALIKALAADGSVDPHKDAVAYAQASDAPRARSCIEVQAEERAVAADALRVEIAKLDDLHKQATEEATRNALAQQLQALQAQLAELA